MRNYLNLWLTDLTWTDTNTSAQTQWFIWGRDEEEMNNIAGPVTASLVAAQFPYVINFYGEAFPMLDKAQLFALIQVAGFHSIQPAIYSLDDSPRDTWVPSRDDSNVNPGTGKASKSDHYASTGVVSPLNQQLTFAVQLENLYDILYRNNQLDAANAVLAVIQKVLKGTVTQADIDSLFAFLKHYGI